MTITQKFDFLVQWHLTERCNLRCHHCYQSRQRGRELSLDEVRDVIEEIDDMLKGWEESCGVTLSTSFNITGGEPMLREDIFRIIADIGRLGSSIFLLTNGTLIDRDRAAMLAQADVRGVQVSMEGPQPIHDAIRGGGSFDASIEGAKNLLAAGLPVTMNMTLSRLNAGYMQEMIALASELGVQRLGFSRFVPAGRGMEMLPQSLSSREVEELYASLDGIATSGVEIVTGDPVANQMHAAPGNGPDSAPCGGCAAGVSGITLMADGTIVPCRRLEIPIGNVLTDSLREVWTTSEVLAMLRDKSSYSGKCGSCDRWANCRGCRAIAYAFSRARGEDDYLAADPHCFIHP